MSQVALRRAEVADLDAVSRCATRSRCMAAFTTEDPSDRGAFDAALTLLLEEISVRPIRARAASDNAGWLRVLQKAGFHPIGTEMSFAAGRATEIEETILELP